MEQSPSYEASNRSVSQQIPHLLWNPNIHYRLHNRTPVDSNLSQMNPVHILIPYFNNVYFNIIIPSMLTYPKSSLPFWFSVKNFVCSNHLKPIWTQTSLGCNLLNYNLGNHETSKIICFQDKKVTGILKAVASCIVGCCKIVPSGMCLHIQNTTSHILIPFASSNPAFLIMFPSYTIQ
jgi:hypothetical protein